MRKTIVRAGLVVAAVAAVAVPSHAFRMIQNTSVGRVSAGAAVACNAAGGFTHWAQNSISWRLNTSGQGSNKATALTSAITEANAVLARARTVSTALKAHNVTLTVP